MGGDALITGRRWIAAALAAAGIAAFGGVVFSQEEGAPEPVADNIRFDLPADFAPLPRLSGEADPSAHWPIARRAWGDSAAGCVVLVHDLTAANLEPGAIAVGLQWGLSAADLQLGGELQANEEQTIWRGTLLAPVSGFVALFVRRDGKTAHASAVTCFWGDREPERCAAACETVMSSAEFAQ